MSFTEEHIAILEKNKHHWEGLRDIGVMRNLEDSEVAELQRVHNEAIEVHHYAKWCKECVCDLVRKVYKQYEKMLSTVTSGQHNEQLPIPNRKSRRNGK